METSEIRIVFFRLQNHLLFIFEQLYGNPTYAKFEVVNVGNAKYLSGSVSLCYFGSLWPEKVEWVKRSRTPGSKCCNCKCSNCCDIALFRPHPLSFYYPSSSTWLTGKWVYPIIVRQQRAFFLIHTVLYIHETKCWQSNIGNKNFDCKYSELSLILHITISAGWP